jgi:hypothetical protein
LWNLTGGRLLARRRIVNGEISHANGQNGLRPEDVESKKSRSEIQSPSTAQNVEPQGGQDAARYLMVKMKPSPGSRQRLAGQPAKSRKLRDSCRSFLAYQIMRMWYPPSNRDRRLASSFAWRGRVADEITTAA